MFGWLGYLLARAYFSRRLKWIVTALALLIFFGTFLGQLLPSRGRADLVAVAPVRVRSPASSPAGCCTRASRAVAAARVALRVAVS